jgi:hypothetical protein
MDSDLAWSDASTLHSALALPPGAKVETVGGATPINPLFEQPAVRAATTITRPIATGSLQSFESQVLIPRPTGPIGGVDIEIDPITDILDPVVWQATVKLPALGAAPARLVLREFERYYTDRTVPERRGNQTYRRRVVEERLVYSEFFPLN